MPSRRLDFELELAIWIGEGNAQGSRIPIAEAERHIFGVSLLNDWSARDIQAWEYQPLGPFLSKSFATTVSPWIVTLEALAPFRAPLARPAGDPPLLAYLDSAEATARGAIDIRLEVLIATPRMAAPHRLAQSSFRHAYWTASQLVTHHTVNGCSLKPGDILATGTLSGPGADAMGSLAEITQGGKVSVQLPDGETRTFLEDEDSVTLRGWCEAPGAARIGLGEVTARVLPAIA
jgi:fumarylacetoacetase